jgi:hypothetical protein
MVAAFGTAAIVGCTGGHVSEGIVGPAPAGSGSNSGSGSQPGCSGVALTMGSSITTSLSKSACVNGVPYQDMYTLTTPTNTPVELTATSSAFPLHISVVDPAGRLIADSSIASGPAVADLRMLVPANQYRITITSTVANTGGIYSLNAVSMAEDVADCTRVFVAPGTLTHQQLLPTDCRIGAAEGDQFLLHLSAGQTAKIVWDDYALGGVTLRVFAPDGALLSSAVSANPSTTTITGTQTGYYLLQFTYTPGGTAKYEFAIQ